MAIIHWKADIPLINSGHQLLVWTNYSTLSV